MKGKELQKTVIDWAHSRGWFCVHFPSVETKQGWRTPLGADAKGFVDIILFRERCIAIEIKGDGDRMKSEQLKWQDRIERAGVEHYVIRPKDWPDVVRKILV